MVALKQKSADVYRPIMRLVRDDEVELARQARERRVFPRREMHITISGKRLDHSIPARRQPMLALAVRDVSAGGLSALSDTALFPGELIAVTFPPSGLQSGWGARGRVVRCEPAALGYRVAVEFENLPSAA
ncbi:PilZ domain-containing protein [Humisphaera borealis]|uniref:PilZ domain-containing protein n=1 Tax=Humisphaera borealis TaxID=2807512 RepID=A0A7M2WP60_9BACT|nr:PilZ domain-containing protein [Humisphaera borealis]QOV87305.1 PilZ domain-containing protein [Humisphaera borealis]